MKQSKLKRLLSGITACAMIAGMLSVYQSDCIITASADDYGEFTEQGSPVVLSDVLPDNNEPYTVKYTTTKFNLTGGKISDENFIQENGICTLKSEDSPAVIPQPTAPENSNLVFSGWTNSENIVVTEFEADTTYYANWKFGSSDEINSYSKLQYVVMNGDLLDIRGNSGNLRTTYADCGYNLLYRANNSSQSRVGFSNFNSTTGLSSGIYVTPVMSFCNAFGEVSEVDSDNVYLKVSYILQNRGSSEVSGIGIASTADVMIGANDRAAIIGYSKDETKLTPQNKSLYPNASTVEMLDGRGNIYSIALPDDASCWWGHYSSRNEFAFSDHNSSNYNTGYDSGIAYSWKDIVLGAGESVTKSVVFSAGDIHIFRTHDFEGDGICNGSGHCGIPMDHTDETPLIYQPAVLVDGVYKVSNAGQLMWIADEINSGEVASDVNIDLTGNISFGVNNPENGSCISTIPWIPIKEYSGTFNGNGYTISGLNYNSETDTSAEENGGLFRVLSGATVENIGLVNSCINGVSKLTGAIAGTAKDNSIIKNIYNIASLSGNKSSGIVYSLNNSTVSDSYFAGCVNDSDHLIYADSNSDSTIQNCYYLSETPLACQNRAVNKNILQFKSGEVAYLLSGSWYQNLSESGKNEYPVLIGENHVYKFTVNHSCSQVDPQAEIIYTNDSSRSETTVEIQHEMVWGHRVKQATCTENEYWTKKCKNCEYETTEIYERDEEGHRATGHHYNDQGYCDNVDPNTNTVCGYCEQPRRLNISGDMHVTPMTYDEIIEAGIDISGEDNYQCVNYSIEMNFEEEIINLNKIEVNNDDGLVQRIIEIVLPGEEPIRIDPSGTYVPQIGGSIIYYEEAEQEMYMIIYGESKWLKEFYDVQLVIVNKDTEVLKNCKTVLDVPDGLTLCNSTQTQVLGDLAPNKVFDIHWYLRGDKAGDYELQALFTGENAGEEFSYTFHSRNTFHVYAGNALNMNIELPRYSFYNKPYTVKIKLTNVSDKPIYKLQNKIKRIKQGYYTTYHIYHDGTSSNITQHTPLNDQSGITSISVDTLNPGESAVVEVSINDMWKSILEQNIDNSKLILDYIRLLSSTAGDTYPVAIIPGVVSSAMSKILSEISVAHVLKSVVVTTLEDSTTQIPYNITVTDDTQMQINRYGFNQISAMTKNKISQVIEDNPESINPSLYDSKFIECGYDPNTDTDEQITYYLRNRADRVAAVIAKNSTDTHATDDLITVGEDVFFMFKTPDNDITAKVYVENVNQNSQQETINNSQLLQSVQASNNNNQPFELSVESGNGEYINGEYNVTGNAIFKINAKEAGKRAIIHIEYSDGYEMEYPIESVGEHQCSGDYVFISPHQDGKVGSAAQICSVCGKIIDVKQISSRYTCMLSNGELFENIRDAASAAAEYNKNGELAIFGNVHITENISIPENISVIIAPNAVVTIDDTFSLSAPGGVTDFGTTKRNGMVNIVLNYWNGRTENMQVPFGTEVTELPQIGTDECPLDGWYCDSEFTQPFESFVAGNTGNNLTYYADIRHEFNDKGICTKCGELCNGYDAFIKSYITVGREIKLNYIVKLSEKAASDNNAYMAFTFADGSVKTQRVSSAKNNYNGTYTFTCYVDVNKMADNIISQIHYSDNNNGSILNYSMIENMNAILRNEPPYNCSIIDSVKALMNLGGYVQKYSHYNTDNLVNKDLDMPVDDEIVVIGDEYKAVKNGNSDNIKAVSASLDISSAVKIKIKYQLAENVNVNDYKFTIDGVSVTPVQCGDMYVVTLDEISPENYDNMYCFKVESLSNPDEWSSINYSVFSYIKTILSSSSDIDTVNAMKALYNYNVAIEQFSLKII